MSDRQPVTMHLEVSRVAAVLRQSGFSDAHGGILRTMLATEGLSRRSRLRRIAGSLGKVPPCPHVEKIGIDTLKTMMNSKEVREGSPTQVADKVLVLKEVRWVKSRRSREIFAPLHVA